MIALHAQPPLLTVEEYERLYHGYRHVELIRGQVVQKPDYHLIPGRTGPRKLPSDHMTIGPKHSNTTERLSLQFMTGALKREFSLRMGLPFRAVDQSLPEPDLAIVPFGSSSAAVHPNVAHLLIEVADSSLEADLTDKATLYAESGVPEYWVVDVKNKRVIVHLEPHAHGYVCLQELRSPEVILPAFLTHVLIPLSDIF